MSFHKRISFWVFIIIAFFLSLLFLRGTFSYIEVKIVPAKRQSLNFTVTATSTGTVKSRDEVKVTAQRMGRIARLNVDEGDKVRKGDLIAELDAEEAVLNLKISQASLNRAEARLNEIKTAFRPFTVEVEKNVEKAGANLTDAGKRLKRFGELREKGVISQMEFDSAQREHDVAKATYESASAQSGQIDAKADEIKAAEEAVREASNSLSVVRLNHDYSFIRSPITGVVASRPVKTGETVAKGSPVATVVSVDTVYIEAFIDEADISRVQAGQEVNITMDAYPGRLFKGEVYMVSPVVLGGKQETRTFEVRTRLREKDMVIKLGMSADIEIVVDSVKNTIVIPSQAITERDNRKFVFIKKGAYAKFVPVRTGRFNWSLTEIISGIREGDEVIVNPDVPELSDGKRVKKGK